MTGTQLKAKRIAAGVMQRDVARALGYTQGWVLRQEKRRDPPRADFARRYLDAVRTLAVAAEIRTRAIPAVRREL